MTAMNKVITIALMMVLLTCGSAFAMATATGGTNVEFFGNNQVQFTPIPSDLGDLDHNYAYTWGIDYTIPQNQFIDTASITFTNIDNWQNEANVLYVNLLNSANVGVLTQYDAQASGNFFGSTAGSQKLFEYTDSNSGVFETYTYTFNATQLTALNAALADGNMGLGFDPDCHYYNNGVSMNIQTRVVPEPISCLLFVVGSGVFGAAAARRRKIA